MCVDVGVWEAVDDDEGVFEGVRVLLDDFREVCVVVLLLMEPKRRASAFRRPHEAIPTKETTALPFAVKRANVPPTGVMTSNELPANTTSAIHAGESSI